MTAAQARIDTDLRARVRIASGAHDRTIVDLLNGFSTTSKAASRVRAALAAEGVDMATIPRRSAAQLADWKRRRHTASTRVVRGAAGLPDGYQVDRCGCGDWYPRLLSEPVWKCPRCWRKLVETLSGG